MKRTFTASITHEGDWSIAQCLEVDVSSQGETADEALANLGEALALHFTRQPPPRFPTCGRSRSRLAPLRTLHHGV